uniref:Uncharacterized protein n=1 Tax=Lotus japonicus TaxID=34305 RepID=I3S9S3_LOTJA|nr:unknown [Lotus japonicus]
MRRFNILIELLIFNSPFNNINSITAIILINHLKDERKSLIVRTDISTIDAVFDCFLLFINGFNTLLQCYGLAIYNISPVFNRTNAYAMPVTFMKLGLNHSLAVVLNIVKLRCKEVEEFDRWGFDPNFSTELTSKYHDWRKNKLSNIKKEDVNGTNKL